MNPNLINTIKWDKDGLVCAIAQDKHSKRILMVAYMNPQALELTIQTGYAHYYSRSRQAQWKKGEQSGHYQKVHEIQLDCDGDAIVMLIEQMGGIACHTGRESCFYRVWQDQNQNWQIQDPVLKNENDIYGNTPPC